MKTRNKYYTEEALKVIKMIGEGIDTWGISKATDRTQCSIYNFVSGRLGTTCADIKKAYRAGKTPEQILETTKFFKEPTPKKVVSRADIRDIIREIVREELASTQTVEKKRFFG